ncbi:MAG: hypothetical protein ACFCUE_06525 [Candidatus Bathyarchaeia archaeon]|jgi:ribosomal protein L24E
MVEECVFCKKALPKDSCRLTYVFEDNLKDLYFCSANCRGNFIEFARELKNQIYLQFSNNCGVAEPNKPSNKK